MEAAEADGNFWKNRGLHVMLNAHRAYGPFPAIIDPLSSEERLLVSEHLRRDITNAAATLLRKEQETKARLQTVHIKCVSLMLLASCAVAYAMIYLQGVLVPFTLAIFFMFFLEPLLFSLLKLPQYLGYFIPMFRPVADQMEKEKAAKRYRRRERARNREKVLHGRDAVDIYGLCDEGTGDQSDMDDSPSPTGNPFSTPDTSPVKRGSSLRGPGISIRDRTQSGGCASSFYGSSDNSNSGSEDLTLTPPDTPHCGDYGTVLLQAFSWRVWSLVSVLLCLASMLSLVAFLIVLVVRSINDFPWKKYSESEKMQMVLEWFPQIGADPDQLRLESVMPWLMQGFLVDAVGTAFKIISMAFLTLLFLAFLLNNDVEMMDMDADDYYGISHKVRVSVRRYIRIKTRIALVVTLMIGFLYWLLKVDLAFLFAIVTFVLSYIPHVGYTISVLAPLPLVFLDPNKTWGDLVLVFVLPFTIHQFASNLVEPKLLAKSLDLHPIIVLLALAFWTTVWGAVGAILSVPLTAVVRLVLLEIDHPYTQPVVNLLKGRLSPEVILDEEETSLTRTVTKRDALESPRRGRTRIESPPSPKRINSGDIFLSSTPLDELKLEDSKLKQARRRQASGGMPLWMNANKEELRRNSKEASSGSSGERPTRWSIEDCKKEWEEDHRSPTQYTIAEVDQVSSNPIPSLGANEQRLATPRSNGIMKMGVATSPPPQPEGDDGVFGEGAPPAPYEFTEEEELPVAQI